MIHRNLFRTELIISVSIVTFGIILGARSRNTTASADEQSFAVGQNKTKTPVAGFSPYVDNEGKITLPKDYKQKWLHLGSWAVARTKGVSVDEMHNVYTQPETITAFNKTGEFPDGAVLVKEVRQTKADRLTTGHSSWSTDMKIWFVMIKDRKERFAENNHWGDGWGWALFEAKDPTKNVSAGYDTSCLACHAPVEDSDWVYSYGYADLKGPKK